MRFPRPLQGQRRPYAGGTRLGGLSPQYSVGDQGCRGPAGSQCSGLLYKRMSPNVKTAEAKTGNFRVFDLARCLGLNC